MRRLLIALLACAAYLPTAQPTAAQSPPQSWLFGTWTGGLFPVTSGVTLEACLAQPVVIFTRDLVLRATLTDPFYAQRVVQTAQTNPGVTEFRFTPALDDAAAPGAGLLGETAPQPKPGFGCENADVLHVRRISENVIAFPGCKEFPEQLVRCVPR